MVTFRPRFWPILAGIAVAGGGGWCLTQGHTAAGVLGFAAGVAVAAAEFIPIERARVADAARQQRTLAADAQQLARDGSDGEWAHNNLAGVAKKGDGSGT
jgi:hypothetical protein